MPHALNCHHLRFFKLAKSGPFAFQVTFENVKENSVDDESYRNDQQYHSNNLLGFPPNLFGFANFHQASVVDGRRN